MIQSIYKLLVFLLLLTVGFSIQAQTIDTSEKVSDWKGFKRIDFSFEGRDAHIIFPTKALPNNPWLWRARFPGYHDAIDSTVISMGFHRAYIDTDNMFGSPEATNVWDRFYSFITSTYNLHAKVAIHAHSRGGLFTYNWACKNPDKVACIYADAVVCDFKSWPAGFGASDGSKGDWKKLKVEYGFNSDAEAKNYRKNPIDNLEALAKAKVPIMHTVGLNDLVVPPHENSLLLVNRYIELGGTATVSPCNSGVQKSKGHHYSIDDPDNVVQFILYNTISKGG